MPEINSSFNAKDSVFYDDFKSMTAGSSFGGFYLDQKGPTDRQTIQNASKVLMTEGEDDSSTPKFIKTA